MNTTFTIRLATVNQQPIVLDLIMMASVWLRGKGTDQWASPWPDERRRDERVRRGLELSETWIVWAGDVPAATMSVCPYANPQVWGEKGRDAALYIHRLVVNRDYAGLDLGGLMIDWAAQREFAVRRFEWIRVDVWTTNVDLHAYYERQGFTRCGTCPDPHYPSGALFQKAADGALKSDISWIVESAS